MRAITLTQPWASLVAIGAKRIETRNWATRYRGPLAIHAAAGLRPIGGKKGLLDLIEREPFWSVLREAFAVQLGGERHYPGDAETITNELPYGAIVAVCDLVAIARIDHYDPWPDEYDPRQRGPFLNFGSTGEPLPDEPERSFGDYRVGRYAWKLDNIRALPEPVVVRGALGLWEYDGELPR